MSADDGSRVAAAQAAQPAIEIAEVWGRRRAHRVHELARDMNRQETPCEATEQRSSCDSHPPGALPRGRRAPSPPRASRGLAGVSVAKEAEIDPQALAALKRMSDFTVRCLRSRCTKRLRASRSSTVTSRCKRPRRRGATRRPHHLKAVVVADDDKSHTSYFDGKTFTLYMPAKNYFAQADLPGTTTAALDTVESRYGVEFPCWTSCTWRRAKTSLGGSAPRDS